jgi:hypothetical protein
VQLLGRPIQDVIVIFSAGAKFFRNGKDLLPAMKCC